jgi:hypothetical protein
MRGFTAAAAAAFLLAACASEPAPTAATSETAVRASAVVQEVDQTTRQVLLLGDDGRLLSLVAGPEIRNLPQLAPGDRVTAVYVESVAARMAEPADARETVTTTVAERAPVGERPGAAAAQVLTSVVTIVGFDPATNIATFTGPTGAPHSVVVPPDMRAFAAGLSPGDQVAIEYTEAVAIGIEEKS